MAYDATKMADWQIAESAEKNMPTPEEWRDSLGLQKDEINGYGRISKLDFLKIINRLKDKQDGKYIEVTAITPTPLGEGKTTTSMGLIEGFGKRGKNIGGAIRQPSGGPTMNIKGTAAGGGNALLNELPQAGTLTRCQDHCLHGGFIVYFLAGKARHKPHKLIISG